MENGLLIYIVIFHATNAEKDFGIILKMALGKRWYFGNVTKPTSTSSPQLVLTDAISPNLSPHRFFRCHDRSPTCSTKSHHGRNKLVAVLSLFLHTETATILLSWPPIALDRDRLPCMIDSPYFCTVASKTAHSSLEPIVACPMDAHLLSPYVRCPDSASSCERALHLAL